MQVEVTRLYRVKAVAEMFDVSRATVYREIEAGRLPALRFGTTKGALRVSGEAIAAYLADKQQAATVVPAPRTTDETVGVAR